MVLTRKADKKKDERDYERVQERRSGAERIMQNWREKEVGDKKRNHSMPLILISHSIITVITHHIMHTHTHTHILT